MARKKNWPKKKIQILKCLEAKESRRRSKDVSAVHPGTSAQISSKAKAPESRRILGNKKSPFGRSQCRAFFLSSAFQSLLRRRLHVACEWNFNYHDAFHNPPQRAPPFTLTPHPYPHPAEPKEGRLIGVHVWLPSKSGIFLWGKKSKSLFQNMLLQEKCSAKDTLKEP